MKRTGLIFALGVLIFISACTEKKETGEKKVKDGYVLSGAITNINSDTIHLMQVFDNYMEMVQASPVKEDGSFEFRGSVDKPGYYRIKFDGENYLGVILENKNIKLVADAKNRDSLHIEGSDLNRDFFNFHKESLPYNMKLMELSQEIRKYQQERNNAAMAEAIAVYERADAERQKFTIAYIDSIFPSQAIFFLYQTLNWKDHLDYQVELSKKMKAKYPDSPLAQEFSDKMNKIIADKQAKEEQEASSPIGIGKVAPEIALPDPSGNVKTLSSLRGNYVLLDFWASWCGPCRHENPNVVRLYNKYKSNKFEILGVSLDAEKDAWLKAIEKDKLTWQHVSDLKNWQSSVVPLYQIQGIPFTVLLDPDGKIIAKNLRGAELENKLAEIFGK